MTDACLLSIRVWTVPKPDAESPRENEDRFWIAGYRPKQGLVAPVTVALSDGASDGLFAREWARCLARSVATAGVADMSSTPLPPQLPPQLPLPPPPPPPRSQDELEICAQAAAKAWVRRTGGVALPWFLEARRNRPTGATALRLAIYPDGRWDALAAGDTCLIAVRTASRYTAFPLTKAGDFSAAPPLLLVQPSPEPNGTPAVHVPHRVTVTHGEWLPGDSFHLMTDALAAWFLRDAEAGRPPLAWLDGIRSDTGFRERIAMLRTDGRLRGDDTTLIQVRLEAPPEESIGLADRD